MLHRSQCTTACWQGIFKACLYLFRFRNAGGRRASSNTPLTPGNQAAIAFGLQRSGFCQYRKNGLPLGKTRTRDSCSAEQHLRVCCCGRSGRLSHANVGSDGFCAGRALTVHASVQDKMPERPAWPWCLQKNDIHAAKVWKSLACEQLAVVARVRQGRPLLTEM